MKTIPKIIIYIIIACALIFTIWILVFKEFDSDNIREVLDDRELEVSFENENIKLEIPLPNALISSPLEVRGEARGTWYFEASFPIELLDGNGVRLASYYAQAEGEWMTVEFVPFNTILTFETPTTTTGTLILHKDNPSGLPEFDDQIRIPVRFSEID
jgi:hypothetical protein